MPEEQIETARNRGNRIMEIATGTLVGLGVIAIVQILSVSVSSLNQPLKISVFSFAVSIPSLSVVFLCA